MRLESRTTSQRPSPQSIVPWGLSIVRTRCPAFACRAFLFRRFAAGPIWPDFLAPAATNCLRCAGAALMITATVSLAGSLGRSSFVRGLGALGAAILLTALYRTVAVLVGALGRGRGIGDDGTHYGSPLQNDCFEMQFGVSSFSGRRLQNLNTRYRTSNIPAHAFGNPGQPCSELTHPTRERYHPHISTPAKWRAQLFASVR
jgi:hypothetical protein